MTSAVVSRKSADQTTQKIPSPGKLQSRRQLRRSVIRRPLFHTDNNLFTG